MSNLRIWARKVLRLRPRISAALFFPLTFHQVCSSTWTMWLRSTVSRVFGVKKAGREGPKRMPLLPRWSSASKTQTAFCSYQEMISDNGNSLTSTLNAFANAEAIWTAESASLHWPASKRRGIPPISPRSLSKKRYLPQAMSKRCAIQNGWLQRFGAIFFVVPEILFPSDSLSYKFNFCARFPTLKVVSPIILI